MSGVHSPDGLISSELVARLETASVGSRELDRLVAVAVAGAKEDIDETGSLRGYYRSDNPARWISIGAIEPVTTSLDAAVALVERVLPSQPEPGDVPWDQWLIELTRSPVWRREPRVTWDCVIGNGLGFGGAESKSCATAPLALCIALLKAIPAASHSLAGDEGDSRSEHNDC